MSKKVFRILSLFAGCGGFSEGFSKAGFNIVGANEIYDPAADSYRYNHPDTIMVRGDICKPEVKDEVCSIFANEPCDVIIGGPPCQAYSLAGRRDPNDPRGKLFREYVGIVKRLQPKVFVMENVAGILSMKHGDDMVVDLIESSFKSIGYGIKYKLLNSAWYGVPQMRQRVIFIGTKDDIDVEFPEPTHGDGLLPYVTARQAIDELKNIADNIGWMHIRMKHSDAFTAKIHETPCGRSVMKGYSEAFFRVMPDEPTKTVKGNHGSVFVHYEQDRTLTPRELATLQSFGYEYRFVGTKSNVLMQIGNSVPPVMAQAIANCVKKMIGGC